MLSLTIIQNKEQPWLKHKVSSQYSNGKIKTTLRLQELALLVTSQHYVCVINQVAHLVWI